MELSNNPNYVPSLEDIMRFAEDLGKDPNASRAPEELEKEQGKNIEREHRFYMRVLDFTQFKEAKEAYIYHQRELFIPKNDENVLEGKMRVRKINSNHDSKTKYELTIKINESGGGKIETNTAINKAVFENFSYLATTFTEKHRYVIEKDGYVWEVDAFPDGKGGYFNWVRLELEVEDLNENIPQPPFKYEEIIMPSGFDKSMSPEEHQEKVDFLYKTIFNKPNKLLVEKLKQDAYQAFLNKDTPQADQNEVPLKEPEKPENEDADGNDTEPTMTTDEISQEDDQADANAEKAGLDEDEDEENKEDDTEDQDEDNEENKDEDADKDDTSEKAEGDDDTENDTPDDENKDEDTNDENLVSDEEKESLNQAKESLINLLNVHQSMQSLREQGIYSISQESHPELFNTYIKSISTIGFSTALEENSSITEQSVLDKIKDTVIAFGKWVSKLPARVLDLIRSFSRSAETINKRAQNTIGQLVKNKDKFAQSAGRYLPYDNIYRFTGNEFDKNGFNNLIDFTLNYHKTHHREELYTEMTSILKDIAFENYDEISPQNWKRLNELKVVPEKGFFKIEENENHETWGKFIPGEKLIVITKPHVLVGDAAFEFSIQSVKYMGLTPKEDLETKVQDADYYRAILDNIIINSKKIDVEYNRIMNTVSRMMGNIGQAVKRTEKAIDDYGRSYDKSVNIQLYSNNIIETANNIVAFASDETQDIFNHCLKAFQVEIDNINKLIKHI